MKNKKLMIALMIPIVSLMLLTTYKAVKIAVGKKIIIPIKGYDPRDILSGHYLIYKLDFGIKLCSYKENGERRRLSLKQLSNNRVKACVVYSSYKPKSDEAIIDGVCNNGRFNAGIERFYIPEKYGAVLDSVVRNKKGSIVVSVVRGHGIVKDLLIDGMPWKDYVDNQSEE